MKKKPMKLLTRWLHRFSERTIDWIILVFIALIILLILYLF